MVSKVANKHNRSSKNELNWAARKMPHVMYL
jgi:hypothetical protein